MAKEIGIGIGLAVVVFLVTQGYDISPLLAVAGLVFIFRYLQIGRGVGKNFEVVVDGQGTGSQSQITFGDVGGQEVAKRELTEALEFIVNADKVDRLGIRPLKGILLTGPPGTGKTLLARAAASHTGSVFIAASGSEFIEMYAGVGAKRVRQLFGKARELAEKQNKKSAIVFIDEIEVLGGERGRHSSHLEYDQTLNQLLVEMDGITGADRVRVLVIGATNRADLLDPALLRPGRFDRTVKVDLPDKEGRLHILKIHIKNKPFSSDVDLDEIAKETSGFSGAHLENLVNEAAILAMRQNKTIIGMKELKEAIDKVIMGEKLDRQPTEGELRRVAVHEVGHAMVSETLRPGSVSTITVTSRGNALGYVRQVQEGDFYLYTKEQLDDQIAILLAGAVAEEAYFSSRSTGSAADFEQALGVARKMISCGMSALGIVSLEDLPRNTYHEAVKGIIAAQETRVRSILKDASLVMKQAIEVLLDEEKMTGERLKALMRGNVLCEGNTLCKGNASDREVSCEPQRIIA